jgi:uncharacterized membrane protein (DUF441 family)
MPMVNRMILVFLIGIAAIGNNKALFLGGIIVLALSFLDRTYLLKLDKNIFLNGGLILLMIWMLMPIIQTEKDMVSIDIKDWLSIEGLVSLLSGLFIVIIAAKGLELMDSNPSATTGIIVGSIIGVTFFGGIPVGILTGSGIAYLIIRLLKKL